MYRERKEDLSVYYFLKDTFSTATFINIEDGYPETVLTIPTVSVEAGKIDLKYFELGNRDRSRVRRWFIDIFAKNKSQRDEIGYKLLDVLKNDISVYDYDMGFPPDVTPTKIGLLQVMSVTYTPVRIVPEMVEKMYYRATISLITNNENV